LRPLQDATQGFAQGGWFGQRRGHDLGSIFDHVLLALTSDRSVAERSQESLEEEFKGQNALYFINSQVNNLDLSGGE
jgi:hypothetical protein